MQTFFVRYASFRLRSGGTLACQIASYASVYANSSGKHTVIPITYGQPVVSGQLRGHKRYRIRFGAGGDLSAGTIAAHFTVYDGLCCMEYSANAALQTFNDGGE